MDAIQEFRVQHSTFGAEFGKSAAIINTTLKSGSNDLHLVAFELLRNRELNGNNFFANQAGLARPPFVQNNFGTTVTGPAWLPKIYNGSNHTFFMFNYEGFRQRQGITSTALYPSLAQLQGNLADDSAGTGLFPTSSAFCLSNPSSKKCVNIIDPATGVAFPGNVIPGNRLDPITQKALPYIPRPNAAVPGGLSSFPTFNTIDAPKTLNDWDQYNLRLDHQITSKDLIYGSFSRSDESLLRPTIQFLGGDVFPLSDRLWTFTYNRIISPTIINEFRFGYNDSQTFRLSQGSYGQDYARNVFGLKNTSPNPIDFGIPQFNMAGFSGVGSLSEAIGAEDENFQFTDNLNITRGKHTLQTGFQISHQRYYQVTDFSGNPSFTFDGRYTGDRGIGMADFLLGTPYQAGGALGDSTQHMVTTYWAGYVQDEWRLHPAFTLNLGIRYEFAASPREVNNRSLYFSPNLGTVVLAGHGVRPEIVDPDYNNFAPRVGFAWRPSFLGQTVIRGGGGIYYATDNFNEEQFKVTGPPFYQPQTINSNPTQPTLQMSNLLPSFAASANLNPFTFDRLNRTPYLSQWSFDIQHSFQNDYLFEVGYTGSTGQKLPQRRNLNIATLDPTGVIPIAQRVPYPNYGFILLAYNGGWSSYHALTARLEKRFSKGFYLLASYTFQKSLDLGTTDEFSAISADYKKFDKGLSSFDVPHRFVASFLYDLPFGRGKSFLGNASTFTNTLLGGWQLNGIVTASSGQYNTPKINTDWLNIGAFGTSRPNIIGDYTTGRSLPNAYVPSSAFDFPRDAQGNPIHIQGNAGRDSIEAPGINDWDLSLFKSFIFAEKYTAQLRFETFNTFNHTQFGPPNLSWGSPNFGKITSTLVDPRLLQIGARFSF